MKYRVTLLIVKNCRKALNLYSQMFGLKLIQDNDGESMDVYIACI